MEIRSIADLVPKLKGNIEAAQAIIDKNPQGFCLVTNSSLMAIGQIEGDATGLWLVSPIAKGVFVAGTIVQAEKIARHWNANLTEAQKASNLEVKLAKQRDMLRAYQREQRELIKTVKPMARA